ncbi:uncharacterized protein LOC126425025 isoform X2 [Schistocerca serialis cubense]|uniref:uncharacterized protein LOC126425025 isoform X2 n=1 Tax=Schistocerca serialis cubense TaxID=2023355 RepID=UPI00214F13FC|nr:uncharacterized protein LOC126425025 isoform X2 [Schistocerca serialis cubense]
MPRSTLDFKIRMTSVGRGRGRVAYTAPLRRPGQPANAPDYVQTMNALMSDVDYAENMLDYVEKQVIAACSSVTATEEVVDTIYNISIRDRNFGRVGGAVLARLTGTELEGFRKAVLNRLQSDYEDREKMLAADGGVKLMNFVCLLGDLYHKVVLRNGLPLRVLAAPLATCLGMVLGRSASKIEIFTQQMVMNGEKLQLHASDDVAQLMIRARELLMGQPPLENSSAWYILLCIDLEARKYTALPDHLLSLYESNIASKQILSLLKKLKSDS